MSMALNLSDCGIYLPAALPGSGDVTDPVGGGSSGTPVNQTSLGVLVPILAIPILGGSAVTYYFPIEFQNNNSTSSNLNGATFWMPNGIIQPATVASLQFTCDSSSETGSIQCDYITGGNWTTEMVVINAAATFGTTGQPDAGSPISLFRYSVGGGSPALTVGNINVFSNGTPIGMIPAGFGSATSLLQLAMDEASNTTNTSANVLTIPTIDGNPGVFSTAYSYETGLLVPDNSGNLLHGNWVQIWYAITVYPGMLVNPTALFPVLFVSGVSSN